MSEASYTYPATRGRIPWPNTDSDDKGDPLSVEEALELVRELSQDIPRPVFEIDSWTKTRREDRYWGGWNAFLLQVGGRLLNHASSRRLILPTEVLLSRAFDAFLLEEVHPASVLADDEPRRRRAADSANYLKRKHRTKRQLAAAGRKGGLKSKTPRKHDPSILDPHLGLSVRNQAAALGIPSSTIGDLRKRHPFYDRDMTQRDGSGTQRD